MDSTKPPRWLVASLLAGLVLLAVLRSAAGTRLDSFTIDEPWHAVAGAAYVQHGDFALNPEHPPLVKLWVGSWLGDSFDTPPTPALREKSDERDYVERVMYRDNDDRARSEEHTSELQSRLHLVCRLLLEKKQQHKL